MNATKDQNHRNHGAGEGLDSGIGQDVARTRVTVGPGDEKMSWPTRKWFETGVSSAIYKWEHGEARKWWLQNQGD